MKPYRKEYVVSELLDVYTKLSDIQNSDEVSQWSSAGIFKCNEKVKNCLLAIHGSISTDDIEYEKCKNHPDYFINKYVKLSTPQGRDIPFELNDLQKDLLKGFHNNRTCRAQVPRQCGATSLSIAYTLWSILFKSESTIYVAYSQAGIDNMSNIFRSMYWSLPEFLRIEMIQDTKIKKEFVNGSYLKFISAKSSLDGVRGLSTDRIVFSDYQFYDKFIFNELLACSIPALKKDGKIYLYSTKNKMFTGTVPACDWIGSYNFMYDKSKDAKWVVETIRNIGWEKFQEEFL